jgi:hypothetical protein
MNKWILALVIGVLAMTTLGQARVSGDADLAVQYSSTGWVEDAETRTWSYSSADAPTYVFSVDDDMTGITSAGMRLRYKQSAGTYKYGIITAVGSYSGGATLITAYMGTDYDLDDEEVTNVAYSAAKSPFGFPMNPDKWTVEYNDNTLFSQASPVSGTYYNVGGISLELPIGLWDVKSSYLATATYSSANNASIRAVFSTSSNGTVTASYINESFLVFIARASETSSYDGAVVHNTNFVTSAASPTTIYLFAAVFNSGASSISIGGIPTVIRAVCAYL